MENKEELSHEELNSVILDEEDIIGTAGNEVIINDTQKKSIRIEFRTIQKHTIQLYVRKINDYSRII